MFEEYQSFLIQKKTELFLVKDQLQDICSSIRRSRKRITGLEEARNVMISIGVKVQEEIKTIVEELVTKAIQPIWSKKYSFLMETKVKRNMPETYLYVNKPEGKFLVREDNSGGGLKDVVSFALRIVCFVLDEQGYRFTFRLDEPGKFISPDKLEKFGQMLLELSESLGIQFIIITHEDRDEFLDIADHKYRVIKKKQYSVMEEI